MADHPFDAIAVEAAAKAIYEADNTFRAAPFWERYREKDRYRDLARAALAAIKEGE